MLVKDSKSDGFVVANIHKFTNKKKPFSFDGKHRKCNLLISINISCENSFFYLSNKHALKTSNNIKYCFKMCCKTFASVNHRIKLKC